MRHEENRRDSYERLSACYYLPEEDTIRELAELEEAMGSVCAEAAEHVSSMRRETDIEQLSIDYSKLFLGPFGLLAPPYGSVYLERERRIMGDSTMDARNRYREVGLGISGSLKEAPDHIAIELEFMYYLIFKEIESIEKSDFENAMDYLRKQRGFLEDHLGAWVSEFADNVEENAGTDFYKCLARATRVFVKKDLDDVLETSIAELSALTAAG
ncbi:MAG: molecular chaperone TorD family protein [Anaerolineales bacterium]|nr:molecular chaperone TorD family protein [Anaerolineales bacterium]